MHAATESFANMVKAENLVDHTIKNGKIDLGESSSKPKRGNFPRKKEGKTQALYQQSQPNPGDTPHTKIIQTISPIT